MESLELLKYPIGKFNCPKNITKKQIETWTLELENFPKKLENLVKNLNDEQLDTVYRPKGWTIRQVIHHVSDSHHHSYTRFKWALTEDKPVIKAYYEDRWAELFDTKTAPIEMSIQHLKAVHFKLVYLIRGLKLSDFKRVFIHPETNSDVFLDYNIGNYAWHGNHHYAHIENLLKRNNWI
ncbi:hydrolase [Tamlana sedimentorum]|uniref:Hydrolase n=1 Tax=Neotamlana sedimentorum TaxID=1435349 RepID=A0A0D7W9S7_9FLAO|nr:putative metal-dependent hydrolase [Tamlana sedimentorum]KJD35896.1 hydrolase [Tamlana sedimentorum]